jgi:hypothetical protein
MATKTNTTAVIGNVAITRLVASARSKWAAGSKDRFALGKVFSELRAEVEKYTRSSEDTNKVSYAEAVRLTGTPLGTAELYRQMYDICEQNTIEPDVFIILSEAGFNLARDLNEDTLPSGIFADNPDLKSVEYLLGLSKEDTKTLVEQLLKDYGKQEAQPVSVETLQSDIGRLQETQSTSKDEDFKSFLEKQIEEKKKTMHNKMLWSLRNLANAVGSLLGKSEEWADRYLDETKISGVLTEQRYQEARKFAESFTLPTANGKKKPAGSSESSKKHTSKQA